jgi:hypothetical protein
VEVAVLELKLLLGDGERQCGLQKKIEGKLREVRGNSWKSSNHVILTTPKKQAKQKSAATIASVDE